MLLAFSIAPSGQPQPGFDPGAGATHDSDASVHQAVAAAVRVVRASGLPNHTDSMFTTLEGDWDEAMAVIKECVDVVSPYGSRISLVMKADIRPGFTGQLDAKVQRVEASLKNDGGASA